MPQHIKSRDIFNGVMQHFSESHMDSDVDNLRIHEMQAVIYPQILIEEFPMSKEAKKVVIENRAAISDVLNGNDDRLLVIVGPCSIHDTKAALEYADLLKIEIEKYQSDLIIIMRVYFEKPRTTIGWKGLINDPHLNGSYNINVGLKTARRLLTDLNHRGIPCGTEFLDCLTPQFITDTICWGAIGARTTESQLHRELASGLSVPIGFKNGTSGDIQVAIDAARASKHRHCFLSITKLGTIAIVKTLGNPDCHIILRGGSNGVNYEPHIVSQTISQLKKENINSKIIIDFSHGNSLKNYKNQSKACQCVCEQIANSINSEDIVGVMIESNLKEGSQKLTPGVISAETLIYGVSITDGCIGWSETLQMFQKLSAAVQLRRLAKKN